MNQEELNNKIAELEKQIAELKQVKVDEKGWKPRYGEEYWCFDSCGDVNADNWFDWDSGNYRYSIENCFKTKEEAEEFGKKLTTQLKYKKYVKEHSEPLDWDSRKQNKWYLDFNPTSKKYYTNIDDIQDAFQVYASSEQVIKDAIEYIGKENVKYLFED